MHLPPLTHAPVPTQQIRHDGIPNWTTRQPDDAGQLHPTKFMHVITPKPFVIADRVEGSTTGHASLADAVAAARLLTSGDASPAIAVVEQRGRFFGHEVWTYSQHVVPLTPSTRLSGSTISDFQPLLLTADFARFSSAHAGLRAIIDGALTLSPTARRSAG